ncbi:MAG: YjjG family noncanonical pyrimidine nucleotidase [Bacteroidetes bacterium]|nr:YjjG family noncanonical pyrimidine nucleotidase [Bacteroidota bacterium]
MKDKHLFFDLDRTLWDFEKNSKQALKAIFKDFNLENPNLDFQKFYSSYFKVNQQMWRNLGMGYITRDELRVGRFIKTLELLNLPLGIAQEMSRFYTTNSPIQTNLLPGAIETLDYLKTENYHLHIITNGFREVQEIKLKNGNLADYFQIVVCSEDVEKAKPNREIFLYAMQLANVKPQNSCMIGDDYEIDYLGALRAGMKAVLFNHQGKNKVRKDDETINDLRDLPARLPWVFKEN